MPRRHKLAFFGLSILTLVAVGRAVTGSFGFLAADFWFTSGLLLVILLSIVDQPHFSKDANIFVNGVAGLVSLAAVPAAARNFLWHVFFAWSLWLVGSSYAIMIVRSRELKREAGVVQIVSRINRDIGRPEAIFSAFFLWGIFAQFSQNSVAFRALLLFWATFFLLNLRGVSSTLGALLTSRLPAATTVDGVVTSFISPRIVLCELDASLEPLPPGSTIELISDNAMLATAAVTDDRVLQRRRFARAVLTGSSGIRVD